LLPDVALSRNKRVKLKLPPKVTKFCVVPEMFVMPPSLMINEVGALVMEPPIVNALPGLSMPGLNTMPCTTVSAEKPTVVVSEVSKVAVSPSPLGTVAGVQLSGVFQSPPASVDPTQVALSAWLDSIIRIKTSAGRSHVAEAARMHGLFLLDRLGVLIWFVFMLPAVMDD